MTKQTDKVKELETKVNELEALLKRAVADYHNLEKRVTEGRSELTKWGTGELLVKMLPTLDHLEQTLSGANDQEKQSGWFKGVELAVKELQSLLQSEGLDQIPADGVFDPNLHEAVDTREPSDAEATEGKGNNSILQIVRKGYTLNGKVLRPAAVVVGKLESRVESQESRQEQEKQEENTSL